MTATTAPAAISTPGESAVSHAHKLLRLAVVFDLWLRARTP